MSASETETLQKNLELNQKLDKLMDSPIVNMPLVQGSSRSLKRESCNLAESKLKIQDITDKSLIREGNSLTLNQFGHPRSLEIPQMIDAKSQLLEIDNNNSVNDSLRLFKNPK